MPNPVEALVHDELTPCPYLDGRKARLPLRHPIGGLTGEQLDQRLACGDRRTGSFLYRTNCPSCSACIPIRVPIQDFKPSRSQRRVLSRGDRIIKTHANEPVIDEHRIALYNKHSTVRGLNTQLESISIEHYRAFLLSSCCETVEISYTIDDVLVAVAILDKGSKAGSAVYCYYDTDYSRLSLGTYSILSQLRLARRWEMDYLYLGLYIAESSHMNYKTLYQPYELLVDGVWSKR
ncbi:MAG: arginyltransferase [Gammaproteobacteria bacterium]